MYIFEHWKLTKKKCFSTTAVALSKTLSGICKKKKKKEMIFSMKAF